MLAVPAGQPFLLARTLPLESFASIEICAAAASAQWLTSWPFRLRRPLLAAILKSCTAKSLGEQAACAAIGASRNRAEASRIFMGGFRYVRDVDRRRHPRNRPAGRNL